MNAPSSPQILTSVFPQRLVGAILVLVAFILIVFDAAGISLPADACSLLMLAVMAIIAFAILKTPGGMTSLIGLLFLGTFIFIAARPIFALVTQNESLYTITFGATFEPDNQSIYRLLAFWVTGIASLFGGYFLVFNRNVGTFKVWNRSTKYYCKLSFTVAFVIVALLLPVMAYNRFGAFASGGYAALYLSQSQYKFDITRLIDFLAPLLYALSVIIGEKRYSRMMLVAVVGYVLTGALVGRRMEAGSWFLVALWHFSAIRRKPIGMGRLLVILAIAACVLESMELLRGGDVGDNTLLVQFFISQGITVMLPGLSWQLSFPPIHTILGSILPMGALFNLLGIGAAETSSIGAYVCSQSSPLLFQSGLGLGSSAFIEVFYVCGRVMALYAGVCGLLGFLLHKWEMRASRSRAAMFFLCACISSLFSVPRGSLNTLSSQIIYLSAFMAGTYVLSLSLIICRSPAVCTEDAHG